MNLKNIFNNLSKFKLSVDFNNKVLNMIDKKKKMILFYYPFIYGLLLCMSIIILLISFFQINDEFSLSFIVILLSLISFVFVIYQIKKLWKNTNLY